MTLLVCHSPNKDLHFAIKSNFAPEFGLDFISVNFRDVMLRGNLTHDLGAYELDHQEFCGKLEAILRELTFCDSVCVTDPRYIFLQQLRDARLEDGFMKAHQPDNHMARRITLSDLHEKQDVADLLAEAQANILEAGRYVLTNTDLRVANYHGNPCYDDPRLELMSFARTAQIAFVKESPEGFHVRVTFPKPAAD